MRVTNSGPQGVPEPYRNNPVGNKEIRPTVGQKEEPAPSDRLELSPEARLIQRLQQDSGASPQRAARLAALKQAIDAGEYRVPAEQIAQRMLQRGFGKDPT